MKRSVRTVLLGLLGTSIGLYMMVVPLTTKAYAYTPYGYYYYGSNTVKPTINHDPVSVVKAASRSLGFNATTDKFTLVNQSATSAVVNVVHNGTSYNVKLQPNRSNSSWIITSIRKVSTPTTSNSGSSTGTTTNGSSTGSGSTGSATTPTTTGGTPTTSSNSGSTPSTGTPSSNVTTAMQQAVNLLNADRHANGLPDLQIDSRLTAVAQNHAQDMMTRNYFSHYNPEGQSPFDRMKQAGITYSAAGENIAINQTIQAAEVALMNSPGHRANILNSTFTKVGIGIAYDKTGNIYIVQNFMKP